MKKFAIVLAGLATVATSVPAMASAPQAWQNINARQARLDARIDQGVRSGALSRREAVALRAEFRALNRLEAQYRRSRPGLTVAERRDLDRRFDRLSAKIRIEKRDRNAHRR